MVFVLGEVLFLSANDVVRRQVHERPHFLTLSIVLWAGAIIYLIVASNLWRGAVFTLQLQVWHALFADTQVSTCDANAQGACMTFLPVTY